MAAGRHALDIEISWMGFADHIVNGIVQSPIRQGLVDNAPDSLQGIFVRIRMDRRIYVGYHNRGEEKQRFTKCNQIIFVNKM